MSSDLSGTPEGRFWVLLDELEKRFPDPEPYAAAPSELRYLAAIDAAASRERELEARVAKLEQTCKEFADDEVDYMKEINELRRDALRYRWLRDAPPAPPGADVFFEDENEDGPTEVAYRLSGTELDTAIDAAMARGE